MNFYCKLPTKRRFANMYFLFCSSVPNSRMVLAVPIVCVLKATPREQLARAISSQTRTCAMKPILFPPYLSDMEQPKKPNAPILVIVSLLNVRALSSAEAKGVISLLAKVLATFCVDLSSSVSSKSCIFFSLPRFGIFPFYKISG